MPRSNPDLEVVVYKYDLFPPVDWDEDLTEELKRQNDLWNKLVQIEHAHVAAVREIGNAEVLHLEAQINELQTEVEAVINSRRYIWHDAKRKVPTPELDARIAEINKQISSITTEAKKIRTKTYHENRDRLIELETKRRENVKLARQQSGCFWTNYNIIIRDYERARQRTFRFGLELKEKGFWGEGRLSCQLINGCPVPKFMARQDGMVSIGPKPEWMRANGRRSGTSIKQGATLKFRAFNYKDCDGVKFHRFVSFPFIMYRPLPEECLIKEIAITRKRIASRWKYAVVFTMTRPKREHKQVPGYRPVAINFGWRKTEDGVRVATAVHQGNLQAPLYTFVPDNIIRSFEEMADMQSERDRARNVLEPKLVAITEVPKPLFEIWDKRVRNRTKVMQGIMIEIYHRWRTHCREWNPELFAELETWFYGQGRPDNDPNWKQKLYNPAERMRIYGERSARKEQANRREWISRSRLYFYRLEARRLVGNATRVIMDDHNMLRTARRRESPLSPMARQRRVMAAPSILRQAIINYCRNHGIEICVFKSEGPAHWRCGNQISTEFPDEQRMLCIHCHEWFDVDINFCKRMLKETAEPIRQRVKAA
jgi:hypothetical protein